jgi:hypothetical protein
MADKGLTMTGTPGAGYEGKAELFWPGAPTGPGTYAQWFNGTGLPAWQAALDPSVAVSTTFENQKDSYSIGPGVFLAERKLKMSIDVTLSFFEITDPPGQTFVVQPFAILNGTRYDTATAAERGTSGVGEKVMTTHETPEIVNITNVAPRQLDIEIGVETITTFSKTANLFALSGTIVRRQPRPPAQGWL